MDNNIMRTQDLDISDLNSQEEDEKILNAVEQLNSSKKDNDNPTEDTFENLESIDTNNSINFNSNNDLQDNDIIDEQNNNEIDEDEIKDNEEDNEEENNDEKNNEEIDNEIKDNEIDSNEEQNNEDTNEDTNEDDINLDDIQNHVLNLNTSSSDNKEEILKVLAKAGITANISIKTPKQRIVDKLIYEDENDKTMATCRANSMHVFDITELSEEDQKRVKKHGLCLHCLNILEQANEIKQAIGQIRLSNNNSSSNSSVTKGISAGQQIRKMFTNAISQYSDKDIMNFTDKNYSLQYFKLAYPLLLDITGKSAAEIKILKLDKKGHPRYSPRIYTINNKQYLMTNDLYSKNLEKFKETFKALNFITEEDEDNNNDNEE